MNTAIPRQQESSPRETTDRPGGGIGVAAIIIGLVLMIGTQFIPFLPSSSKLLISGFGVIIFLLGVIMLTIINLYNSASADLAFVRTGMGGPQVVIDGGACVLRLVHRVTWVDLNTMKIEVSRMKSDALITGDKLRAEVIAVFYVKVKKERDSVLTAATSLGGRSVNAQTVKDLLFEKFVSALRSVAATMPLSELNEHRQKFAEAVQKAIEDDLKSNGITLESVSIPHLDQAPKDALRPQDNVFDAEGDRKITEMTQAQLVQSNKARRDAELAIQEQNVTTAKAVYAQEIAQAAAEAEKAQKIQAAKAKELVAEQERDREVAVASVAREQAVEVANVAKVKAKEVADIERTQTKEVRDRERQIVVAQKEKEKADAETLRLRALAEQEQAQQEVETVKTVQTASREKQKTVIAKEAEAESQKIAKNTQADIEAYQIEREAKAKLTAAESEAQAQLKLAEADKGAMTLKAEGERAVAMVPVDVDGQKIVNERQRVEVLQSELKAKADHQQITVELQITLARIEAEKEIGVASAQAMGEALGKSNMTIWGDSNALAKFKESFHNGQGAAGFAQGLLAGAPAELRGLVGILQSILDKRPSGDGDAKDAPQAS